VLGGSSKILPTLTRMVVVAVVPVAAAEPVGFSQLILVGEELLDLWVGSVAIVGSVVAVASLAVVVVVPCVHHLRGFLEGRGKLLALDRTPTICTRKC
jgi:hypothetical protein